MCDSNSKPEYQIGDRVKCVRADFGQYVDEGEIYTIKEFRQGCFGGMYVVLEEIEREHSYDIDRFELVVETPQPKFKAGDKVKTLYGEFEILWVGNNFYSGKQGYVCYKEGFNGHSARATVGANFFENTKYKGQCWNFSEDGLELMVENNFKQTPKNYRELTPDTLIDISIDGNEFKVPLGDLIHAKALIGVANGLYGYSIFKALEKVFDKESVIINNHKYSHIHAVEAQDSLIKSYFIDKEKEAKKESIKRQRKLAEEAIILLDEQLKELDAE